MSTSRSKVRHTKTPTAFARAVAAIITERIPEQVVMTMAKSARVGRVLIDWSQNNAWKSTVAPWSVRGFVVPTVAVPLDWADLELAATTGQGAALLALMGPAVNLAG